MNPVKNYKSIKNMSMGKAIVQAMVPIFVLVPVLIGILFQSMVEARNIVYKYIEDTAALRVEQMSGGILKMNNEMISSLGDNPDILFMPDQLSPRDALYYPHLFKIMEQNRNLKIRYPEAYFFYVYGQSPDVLIGDKGIYYKSSESKGVYGALLSRLRQEANEQPGGLEWMYLWDGSEEYLCSCYYDAGIVQGSVIRLDDLFESIGITSLGYEGIPFFIKPDGTAVTHSRHKDKYDYEKLVREESAALRKFSFSGMKNIELYMLITRDSSVLDKIITLQMALVITTVGIGLCFMAGIYIYYKKILLPMKGFVAGLKNIGEEQWIHDFQENHILELEMASKEFKSLLRKIKNLRIQVYEKELEKQKIELDYVQEQIKPHFYLNCLNLINTMAISHGEDEIAHITEKLSLCMRYVIKDSFGKSRLSEELAFVQSYLEIQQMRYGKDAFSFELLMEETFDMEIPPLLLQTFVENSVVHGITLEKKIEITLYLVAETIESQKRLYICISDTGKGFSEDTLDAIHKNRPIYYGERKHIGIQNAMKRLEIMYGGVAQIKLSNMEGESGAVVELILPVCEGILGEVSFHTKKGNNR